MKHIIHSFSNIPVAIGYYVGTNKRENTHILDLANKQDIWFHAEDSPSCHVIARVPGPSIKLTKKQKMTIIKMGCLLCKSNTNNLKNQKQIGINYTEVKNIEKSETEGTVYTSNLKVYTV